MWISGEEEKYSKQSTFEGLSFPEWYALTIKYTLRLATDGQGQNPKAKHKWTQEAKKLQWHFFCAVSPFQLWAA